MSSSITLSAATRQNLLSLQDTANLLSTTQNRLSTGKKVNTALDSPVNYFTSQALNSRSSDLSTLLDGISNGIQTIQAANQGITNLQKLTDQLKSTALQGLASSNAFTSKATAVSTATGTATNANILGGTVSAATSAGTAVTGLAGTTLLNSSASPALNLAAGNTIIVNGQTITVTTASTGVDDGTHIKADDTVANLLSKINAAAGTTSTLTGGVITFTNTSTTSNLTIGGTAAALTALGLTATTGTGIAPTSTGGLTGALTVKVGDAGPNQKVSNITLGTGGVTTLDGLNAILNQNGAQALIDANGKLNITTTNEAGTKTLALSGAAAASFGTPTTAQIGGDGQNARSKLTLDYNNLLTQFDQLAKDASFNGVNLLSGDNLKITFNEKNTSQLNVQGTSLSAAGLGLNNLGTADFNDSDSINGVLSKVSSAVAQLKSQAATYGNNLSVVQNRQDFTKGVINVLDTGSANLVNADLNEEAANSNALSTRNSLAISALSLANQSQQGILQLLR